MIPYCDVVQKLDDYVREARAQYPHVFTQEGDRQRSVLVVLAGGRDKYLNEAKQVFASAYFNGKWRDDYLLLTHNIPDNKLQWFLERGIFVKKCDQLYEKPERLHRSPVNLICHHVYSTELRCWDRVISLDSDTLINRNINHIREFPRGLHLRVNRKTRGKTDNPCVINNLQNLDQFPELKTELEPRFNDTLYNGGVQIFSTDIIEENTLRDLVSFGNRYMDVCLGEQVLISMFFADKIIPLDYTYNSRFQRTKSSIIFHFQPKQSSYLYKKWQKNLTMANSVANFTHKKEA